MDENGKLVGMLTRMEVFSAARSPDRFRDVQDLMRTEFPSVSPEADLYDAGNSVLQESGLRAVPEIENGQLVGMLTVDDIGQANLLRDLRKEQY